MRQSGNGAVRLGVLVSLKQPLDVLASCNHKGLDINLMKSAQTKLNELVPLLGLAEHGFNPYCTLALSFQVVRRGVVVSYPVKKRLINRPLHDASIG